MPSEHASIEQLASTPYIQVLTYPRISLPIAKSRVKQLQKLGITELIFDGHSKIGRLGILGIGTVGVVVQALAGGEPYALKIRRIDANRPNMDEEARIATLANRVDVGPRVAAHSNDFILMKLLKSQELDVWLKGLSGRGTRDEARQMVHTLLNQCRKLDIMGIDHGQLSNLRKHAVVSEGVPWIIDFESAATSRKPRNVSTAAQYLVIGGRLSPRMRKTLGIRETGPLLKALTEYKRDMSDYRYSKILEALRIL